VSKDSIVSLLSKVALKQERAQRGRMNHNPISWWAVVVVYLLAQSPRQVGIRVPQATEFFVYFINKTNA